MVTKNYYKNETAELQKESANSWNDFTLEIKRLGDQSEVSKLMKVPCCRLTLLPQDMFQDPVAILPVLLWISFSSNPFFEIAQNFS